MTTGSKVYTTNSLKIGIHNIVAKDSDKNSIPQPPNSLTSSLPNSFLIPHCTTSKLSLSSIPEAEHHFLTSPLHHLCRWVQNSNSSPWGAIAGGSRQGARTHLLLHQFSPSCEIKGQGNFSSKGPEVNTFGFAGPKVSFKTTQPCCCDAKAATRNKRISVAVFWQYFIYKSWWAGFGLKL